MFFGRPKTRLYKFTVFLLAVLAVCAFCYGIYTVFSVNDRWTTARLENTFNAEFPDDVELMIEGRPSLPVVNVQFTASSEIVEQVVSTICSGILRQGFDPFHDIVSSEPLPDTIRIDGLRDTQYVHSPDTPDTVVGNRCVRNGVINIRVDQTHRQEHVVTLQKIFVSDLNGYNNTVIECGFC